MAIVNMTEFDLFTFKEDRRQLLDELQRFEYIHFSDTSDLSEEREIPKVDLPSSMEENQTKLAKLKWILDLLEPRVEAKSKLADMKEGLKWYSIDELKEKGSQISYERSYRDLTQYVSKIEKLEARIASKQESIEDLKVWKDLEIEIDDIEPTRNTVVLTGSLPNKNRQDLERQAGDMDYVNLNYVSRDEKYAYYLAIILKDQYKEALDLFRNYGFSQIKLEGDKTPREEIELLEKDIDLLKQDVADLNSKIDSKLDRLEDFELLYEYLANQRLELSVSHNFLDLEDVNIIKGYIPTDLKGKFEQSVEKILGNKYFIEFEDADKNDESVPVLLENKKIFKPFESILEMYSMPTYSEMDPTPVMAIFYWVFFGMMVADFGYGLILAIFTAIALKSFNLSKKLRDSLSFLCMLSVSVMIWGLLYGSFFGIDLPFHVLDSSDNITLLILSIVLGAVHLFFGLGIKGYLYIRDGKVKDAIYDVLFWYMALIGLALVILGITGVVGQTVKNVAMVVMIIGMVGIVLFAGRESDSIPGRLALGAYDLYGISSWLGDFVSYSRLMALGLSGGFIAVAINMIIDMLPKNIIGIVAGVVIFLGGHAFNIFLSYLSAYVHDIRLAYVEFLGKFYTGGGNKFNIFKNDTKYINIK